MFRIFSLLVVGLVCLPTWASAQSTSNSKRVALVVGNGAYTSIPGLTNPANDATLIAHTLARLGFTIVGRQAQLNLTKAQFERVLQDFGARARDADIAVFYYAGHGVQVSGANWLVPVNAAPRTESDVPVQMIDANDVLRHLDQARAKLNLVILDACRNNPFADSAPPGLAQPSGRPVPGSAPVASAAIRSAGGGLGRMTASAGTIIVYATQPGNVALDGTGANSPFSAALAEVVQRPGLDVLRMFNEVGLQVSQATKGAQQPWVSLSPISGSFYFSAVPPTGTSPGAANQNRFDGIWAGRMTCKANDQLPIMNVAVSGQITDGEFVNEQGAKGKPGYRSLRGQVQSDDTIEIAGSGIAAFQAPGSTIKPGETYYWAFEGRFISARTASLKAKLPDMMNRGCEFLLTR